MDSIWLTAESAATSNLEYHWGGFGMSCDQPETKNVFGLAAAWLCLLAVALLYAPLAGAALLASWRGLLRWEAFATFRSIITTSSSRLHRNILLQWIAGAI